MEREAEAQADSEGEGEAERDGEVEADSDAEGERIERTDQDMADTSAGAARSFPLSSHFR